MKEVETAQARIRELSPEAAIPKEMRPEYEELKDEISRLGGTQKVREMLAASEATNRQAFMQNKRLVAATPGRVVTDPLFKRVRFDVLIVEDAPCTFRPRFYSASPGSFENGSSSPETLKTFKARIDFGANSTRSHFPNPLVPLRRHEAVPGPKRGIVSFVILDSLSCHPRHF